MIDTRRHVVAIGAGTDKEWNGGGWRILPSKPPKLALDLKLSLRLRKIREFIEKLVGRNGCKQIVDGGNADLLEHRRAIGVGKRQVPHQALSFTKLS
jgi:hypothetical protein